MPATSWSKLMLRLYDKLGIPRFPTAVMFMLQPGMPSRAKTSPYPMGRTRRWSSERSSGSTRPEATGSQTLLTSSPSTPVTSPKWLGPTRTSWGAPAPASPQPGTTPTCWCATTVPVAMFLARSCTRRARRAQSVGVRLVLQCILRCAAPRLPSPRLRGRRQLPTRRRRPSGPSFCSEQT